MNAMERLRQLLDERGIEWTDGDASHTTEWTNANGQKCSAMYWKPTFTVLVSGCTPEQAIAATLGSGTCEMETSWDIRDELGITDAPEDTWGYRCSTCEWLFRYDRGCKPNYCPNCGAKVVER